MVTEDDQPGAPLDVFKNKQISRHIVYWARGLALKACILGVAKLMVDNCLKDCNYQISAPINCAGGALAALKPPLRKRLPISPAGAFLWVKPERSMGTRE
jgi:hypothetical protein